MGNTNITKASSVANTSSVANASSVVNASSVANVANVATGTNGPHTSLWGQMDDANRDALKVLKESGSEAFVEHCFNPTGKKQLTYSEMRMRYG